nr:cation transporter [Pseudoroseomonas ludipueritiae]
MKVTGMSCEHCARAITQAIRAADPGAEVRVDLTGGTVRAVTTLPRDKVQAAIEEEGYGVAG